MPDPSTSHSSGSLTVRPITAHEAAEAVAALGGSFLQTPGWARSKPDWRCQHLGWFTSDGTLVGAGTALARRIPRRPNCFVYVPGGPALPWDVVDDDPARWIDPLVAWAKDAKAFALRLGFPLPLKTWTPAVVKEQLASGGLMSFTTIPPSTLDPVAERLTAWLDDRGWTSIGWGNSAAVGQPRYVCVLHIDGRTEDEVLKGMNQQWRRNIKKATKSGVVTDVLTAGPDATLDSPEVARAIDEFHRLYVETGERDEFLPRAKSYFEGIWRGFSEPDAGGVCRIYQSRVDDTVLASSVMVTVGTMCSYLYGGTSAHLREARASNALQWQAIRDAMADGCTAYDFRGFNTSLGASEPLTGLLQFKLGAGADVVELIGEREIVLSRFWHRVFETAMAARVRINTARAARHEGAVSA